MRMMAEVLIELSTTAQYKSKTRVSNAEIDEKDMVDGGGGWMDGWIEFHHECD